MEQGTMELEGMNWLITVEIERGVALRLLEMLDKMPMPPVDQEDMDAYTLRLAIREALEQDDALVVNE